MQQFETNLSAAFNRQWHAAVDPLHLLTWQTAALFAFLILSAALIATWLLSISWIWPWTRPLIAAGAIKPGAHTYKDHVRLSTADYLRFHRLGEGASKTAAAVTNARQRDLEHYYVVTIVERQKRKVVVYRELKLQCPMGGKYQTSTNEVQLDEALLTQVRFENGNVEDDEPDTPIAGTYDVYVRRVRWYDVRHWLLHPNREIRIVIWVTLITTTVPMLRDLLFG
ncbi:MAG: hypothetical protein JNL81_04380 [Hyphomonadaceae bacterium]|nr:hypothetical protein [Hyphomonadaceae bacterium]